ncbi:MAG TPA: hypothetical protein VJ508_20125, partial [Saprospiraceae bacterium]|nr:hypothetical protein [Saprospiraceae bacterium]
KEALLVMVNLSASTQSVKFSAPHDLYFHKGKLKFSSMKGSRKKLAPADTISLRPFEVNVWKTGY